MRGNQIMKLQLFTLVLMVLVSCSSPEESARELLNRALSEQRAGNLELSLELLQSIVDDYPQTEVATEANQLLTLVSVRSPITTKQQIDQFESALALFRFEIGRYPTGSEGLQALVKNPGIENWGGPYLESPSIPVDPWGRPYQYQSPGQHGDYDLWSEGADGAAGGAGENLDITSW